MTIVQRVSAGVLRRLDRRGFCRLSIPGLALSLMVFTTMPSIAAEQVIKVEESTLQQGQSSQIRIDKMDEETAGLWQEYRQLQRQREGLAIYNANLEKMIESQQGEMVSLEKQLENIEITQREIVPLMLRMRETLGEFVALDVPFLAAERKARIAGLEALMNRADVTLSEKFRQIMAAYQSEADYGRTIETYQGELNVDGQVRSVSFLRVGRMTYVYQTLDQRESGFWHPQQRSWEPLDNSYQNSIRQGIRIANRQLAPDLIRVPVVISEVAQ